jgi:peptidoglycan/xylan/chitin deacetylase (PgdA/CDA1 family)
MTYTYKELAWLNKIIHQRICSHISLELSQQIQGINLFEITHRGESLKLDKNDFADVFGTSKQYIEFRCEDLTELIKIIFHQLTRAEELTDFKKDSHGRFPSTESKAHRANLIETPVVDKCIDILRKGVLRQWPMLKLTKFNPETLVTCDVDNPYEFYLSNQYSLIRKLAGDLVKRKSPNELARTWRNYRRTGKGDYSFDENNTFDWMMDVNEKVGNKMAFYFLVDQSVPAFDSHYSIDEPRIRQLMRQIYDRGHEIGLHASYGTYKNAQQMKKEADKLRKVMDEEGIKQDEIGSRQHYLRWSTPETARHLEAAGIAYDTTLGYADHAGFRCGTSYEFPMFDVENQKILNLREKPLIMMEASVLNAKYMNMGYSDDTLRYMRELKDTCHRYGGTFTMLWHNCKFKTELDKVYYEELCK